MDDEDLVVTDAMRRAVNREACMIGDHDFDIVVEMAGNPTDVICRRCGDRWTVAPCDGT